MAKNKSFGVTNSEMTKDEVESDLFESESIAFTS